MRFRQFALRCECGLVPTRIRQVGLSVDHQLVIHWWCIGCRKAMFVVKDLAECWEECPKPEDCGLNSTAPPPHEVQRSDEKFLQQLGICFPTDREKI